MGEVSENYTYIYSQTSVPTQLHDMTKTGRDVSFARGVNTGRKSVTGVGEGDGKQTTSLTFLVL